MQAVDCPEKEMKGQRLGVIGFVHFLIVSYNYADRVGSFRAIFNVIS